MSLLASAASAASAAEQGEAALHLSKALDEGELLLCCFLKSDFICIKYKIIVSV